MKIEGSKKPLGGYLLHEAVYIVLCERGEPMTTDDLVAELQASGETFWGQFPSESLRQSIRRGDRDGCLAYRDRKWSIAQEMKILPFRT